MKTFFFLLHFLCSFAVDLPQETVEQIIDYVKSQHEEKSFALFLETVSLSQSISETSEEDRKLYEEAYQIYDREKGSKTHGAAEILALYDPVQHKNSPLFGYLVALSFANLGDFSTFYKVFFRSYAACPNHYLVSKTRSVIGIKLYERTGDLGKRETLKESIYQSCMEAIDCFSEDTSLYRILIDFSPEEKKKALLEFSVSMLLEKNLILPRLETLYYIDRALEWGRIDLA